MRQVYMLLMVVMAVMALALACAPAATPTPTPTPTSSGPRVTPSPTATATPSPTPTPQGPTGTVTLGVANVPPALFVPAKGGAGWEEVYHSWGVVQFLMYNNAQGQLDPSISPATSWELAPDLSKVTFKIRQGIPWHSGEGTLDVDDVVWSHNNALREGSTFWGVGNIRPWMDRWEKVDNQTAVMYFKDFEPRWDFNLSNYGDHQPWIFNKKLVDKLGEEQANTTPDGTGPYKVLSWKSREKVELEAVVPHWQNTAKTKRLNVVEIPESLARIAAFEAGEVDIIDIPNNMIQQTQAKVQGSRPQQAVGPGWIHILYFTGNYWAQERCVPEGKLGTEFPGFTPDAQHPWIGDPRDPARMESAQKVRRALSLAIDKQAIVNSVFGGLGVAGGTDVGFLPTDEQWKDNWTIPYDPEQAKQLVKEAGYPNGFTVELWNPPDNVMNPEAGQAIAQMWRQIGLQVDVNSSAYAAMRPNFFDGKMNAVMYFAATSGNVDALKAGQLGPASVLWAQLPCDVQQLYFNNKKEPSKEKRIENNAKIQDYINQWSLSVPFATVNTYFMVGPRVKSWTPHFKTGPYITNTWTIELK